MSGSGYRMAVVIRKLFIFLDNQAISSTKRRYSPKAVERAPSTPKSKKTVAALVNQ